MVCDRRLLPQAFEGVGTFIAISQALIVVGWCIDLHENPTKLSNLQVNALSELCLGMSSHELFG